MKKLVSFFLILSVSCTTYNKEKYSFEEEHILVGKVNWEGFTNPPFSDWFAPTYLDYAVDTASLELIKLTSQNFDILMFMGTWCTDSQVEVPQFYKILDYIAYDIDQMTVVALEKLDDGKLASPQHEETGYAITHVPTFIFLKDGKEIGRITEYPEKTIEKDIVEILSR